MTCLYASVIVSSTIARAKILCRLWPQASFVFPIVPQTHRILASSSWHPGECWEHRGVCSGSGWHARAPGVSNPTAEQRCIDELKV